ncbi:sensor histidine kinase [Acrocarpospora catenulata]|uniref:sensor histidine kinase n=1 Tax=Acrocarpospora catenulata TaxID=2836182 RepID=UPI001BDAA4B2|nr:histidine kinase [Acrocarpospora catenulata]
MTRAIAITTGGAAALTAVGVGLWDGTNLAAAVVAAGWAVTAAGCLLVGRPAVARWAGLVAVLQAAAAIWTSAVPIAVAGWLAFALALPDGELRTLPRRMLTGVAAALCVGLTALNSPPSLYGLAAILAAAAGATGIVLRCPPASPRQRAALQWTGAALLLAGSAGATLLGLYLLLDVPASPLTWLVGALVLVPVGALLGHIPSTAHVGDKALLEAVVTAGFTVMIASVYLVVVLGLGRIPDTTERDLLVSSMAAALVVAVLAFPLRVRLLATARAITGRGGVPPEEVLATFGARMSRAVPFDELLLQLAESLKAAMAPAGGAEIWVGSDGVLNRTMSVPDLPAARLVLNERERIVVGRTRVGGGSWLAVWMPALLPEAGGLVRVAPAAHLGELLGLIVVRRQPDAPPFSEADDQVLVQLGRQVGLALHNMRLDLALQASLDELRRRNEDLQKSRLRIVTAADAARRAIERDLHDGAQQHLVALSVKLSLAGEIIADDPAAADGLFDELRADVQGTITAVRELAHGVYPPLLRNHGLDHALRSAARRSPLPCTVTVDLPQRYSEAIEAAVYFCCLEAIQNAGKHAGADAAITVRLAADARTLTFEVADDGVGFDQSEHGGGFVNMSDRLGAIGGSLTVTSQLGAGTRINGEIPCERG